MAQPHQTEPDSVEPPGPRQSSPAPPPRCPACGGGRTRPRGPDAGPPLLRCPDCRSAFLHPVPSPTELRSRYEREHAEGKWGEIFRAAPEAEATWRLELLEDLLDAPGRVLDVGCGDGTFLAASRRRGWEGAGLEISLEAARAARSRSEPVPVVVGAPGCVAPGAGFDAATFWDVLEHVPDPLALIRDGTAGLRPGGVAAATMPNVHGTTAWLHGRRWTYWDPASYGHLVHFSLRGLVRLFERAGLEVVHARTRGSTDLRHVPEVRWGHPVGGPAAAALDRLSGLLARVAVPLGYGNTLVVVGRAP